MFSNMFKQIDKNNNSPSTTQHLQVSQTVDELNKGHYFEERALHPFSRAQQQYNSNNQDARNAMWYYLRAALRGDKEAQYKIGLSYLNGQLGLDRSYLHAEKWLDQAAHQGHRQAKSELQDALNRLAFS